MDIVGTLGTAALTKAATGIADRYGGSVGAPFAGELQSIRTAIDQIRELLKGERIALLDESFEFIRQDDLDAARRSLTRAKVREPKSAVVRFWLGVVLAAQRRPDAERELAGALLLNPFVVPSALAPLVRVPRPRGPALGPWKKRVEHRDFDVRMRNFVDVEGVVPNLIRTRVGRSLPAGAVDRLENRYWWKGSHGVLLFASLGGVHPVVAWRVASERPEQEYDVGGFILSCFDAHSGAVKWHNQFVRNVIFATPLYVVCSGSLTNTDTCLLFSLHDGRFVEKMRSPYFTALYHPPYASTSPAFAVANRWLHPDTAPRFSIPKRPRPPTAELVVEDPLGWGLRMRVRNEWSNTNLLTATAEFYEQAGRAAGG